MVTIFVIIPVWTYYHHNDFHGPSSLLSSIENPYLPPPIFTDRDTPSITFRPWVIQNLSLGTGTYGIIHLANHENREEGITQVACKTVGKGREKLELEINVIKSINHPNLLGILDIAEEMGELGSKRIHLILELVTGGDLFSYIEKHRCLTEDEVKFMAYQLIAGLAYLHDLDIVHRGESSQDTKN